MQMFFDVLLPPVIFNAGYSVKKKLFFANFATLTLFGVMGTFASVLMITAGNCDAVWHNPLILLQAGLLTKLGAVLCSLNRCPATASLCERCIRPTAFEGKGMLHLHGSSRWSFGGHRVVRGAWIGCHSTRWAGFV
jgi:hypothetical protein